MGYFVTCEEILGEQISSRKAAMIRQVTEGRCECCGREIPPIYMEIHFIDTLGKGYSANHADSIIILCRACHRGVHASNFTTMLQSLIQMRSQRNRQRINNILSRDKPYTAPKCGDPAELFSLAVDSGGMDLFLNGA